MQAANSTLTATTRIGTLFARLRQEGRPALIGYLTAGDPHPDLTPELVWAMERGGADLVELGVPFSDPIADGPVIQRGVERALHAGTSLKAVLDIASRIREKSQIPLLLFSYLNPVMRYGFEDLAREAAQRGVDGVLLTDLSVEEAHRYVDVMRQQGLDTVFLAAPTSSPERQALVAKYSTGFVYLVSRAGVTGEQASVSAAVGPLLASMRQRTALPLAVGFGIARPEHVAEVGQVADGVAVGSAIVRLIEQHAASEELPVKLEQYIRSLYQALPHRNP